ncbi:4Fe-4S binding protein [Candidatus Woesearchaeota archaeon]|nr:4Fe-4S binding protein [Candidatus Woesearchaeota archaeon]
MGHIIAKDYLSLQKRLDMAVQGAPKSETIYKILEVLFTKKEAEYASLLPLKLFTAEDASIILNKPKPETKKILNKLADKGILLDFKNKNSHTYFMAPTMAGFFEFALMRTDGKFNTKLLSELFYQYLNKENDYMQMLYGNNPPVLRVFPEEESIEKKSVILDYEKTKHIINTASCITVARCYCRHKMEHLGKACNAPQMVCLSFNKVAESLLKHGISKEISKKQAHEIINKCMALGLVQIGDNIQEGINWICNCCSCCCEALGIYQKFGPREYVTNNFVSINKGNCIACGTCVKKCPVGAISLNIINGKKRARVDPVKCIGCGICGRFCPQKSIKLYRKKKLYPVPKDTFERIVLEAINQGKLQNYLYDNFSSMNNQVIRKFLDIIIHLPPAERLAADQQLQSRFIKTIANSKYGKLFRKTFNDGKEINYSHDELKLMKKKK